MRTQVDSLGFTIYGYAIQRPDGKYYNGRANVAIDDMFTDIPMHTYTYTESGAYKKISTFPCFADCKVVSR